MHEIEPLLLAMMAWGDKHLSTQDGPPTVPRHADCGAQVRVLVACEAGHDLGDRPRLVLESGPGSRLRESA